MKRTTTFAGLALILFAIASCSGSRDNPAGAPIPLPTYTERPTYTPYPTYTGLPQITPTDPVPAGGVFACIPNHERQTGVVTRVVDGDTIDVRIDGEEFPVRYIGIDTPEAVKPDTPVQYFGPEASEKNRELVAGKTVVLVKDVSEIDPYDRLLRYVIADGVFVNYELVAGGYARRVSYPPDVSCDGTFQTVERAARKSILGLWATPTPAPTSTRKPTATRRPTATEQANLASTQPLAARQAPVLSDCDPSYPTVCIPPPPPDLDCPDISFRRFQVLPPDPHRFDGDHDGIGCER